MKSKRHYIICFLMMIFSLSLSGCWDRKELQERHLVTAVAIDIADAGQDFEIKRAATFVQPHGSKRYQLSLQILDIEPSKSGDSKVGGKISTYVISNTGESMFEMLRDMLGQVSRGLWFEHIQSIVISEAAARQGGLQPLIDLFHRDAEMRWLTKILITPGEARRLLEYQPPSGEASGAFMANSLRLYKKNTHVPGARTDVSDLIKSMDNKNRVLIARVELVDNVVKLGGMGLFKAGKFVGYVDEYATQGGKFLGAFEKSAVITVECPKHPGKVIAFELFHHDTKLKPHVHDETIDYTLDIAMSGNLGEMQCGRQHDAMDVEEIRKIEQLVAEEVKRNVLYAFHTYQKLKLDASVFDVQLKAHEPLVWKKVKDNWNDEVFPNISLEVSVNVRIDNIGEHK